MATRKPIALVNGLFEEVNTPTDKLDFAGNTTTDLTEGSNLYYLDSRARQAISLSTVNPSPNVGLGSLTYDNVTGAFSFTQVTNADVRGLFSVTPLTGIDYNSATGVFGLSNIPNSSLTNSVINITDAFGVTTAVPLGNSPGYDIGPAATVIDLVRNETGTAIPRGTPVAIVGYASGRHLVAPASASNPALMPAIGLAYEQIPTGNNGSIVALGVARQIDTSTYTVGQMLYVGTTPGSLVTSPPAGENNLIQFIGKVTSVATNGRVLVLNPGVENATPNLNNGKIFIGNVSNQAVTATLNTSIVPELTNLYYTDARARAAISVTDSGGDGSLSYDNLTGVITYVGPSASDVRAHFSVAAGSGLTYNSSTGEFGTSNIPNAQLQNSSITIGSSSVALGGTVTTIAGLLSLTSATLISNDGGFRIRNTADNTKQIAFSAASIATATTRTLTVPDLSGTLALLEAANIFTNVGGQRFQQNAINDALIVTGSASGSSSFAISLSPASLTNNRSIVFPDLNGNVLLDTSVIPGGSFVDSTFRVSDNADNTKKLAFECTNITAGTTRTMTIPDENGTISTQDFATAIAIALG